MLKSFGGKKKTSTFAALFGEREAKDIKLGYGVIGNTTDSGPVIPGSSPGIPTNRRGFRNHLKPLLFLLIYNLLNDNITTLQYIYSWLFNDEAILACLHLQCTICATESCKRYRCIAVRNNHYLATFYSHLQVLS